MGGIGVKGKSRAGRLPGLMGALVLCAILLGASLFVTSSPAHALADDKPLAASALSSQAGTDISQAAPIALNGTVSGNLSTSSTKDWYKVTLPNPGKFQITFGGDYATSGSWKVALYTSANSEIWNDTHSARNTEDQTICTVGLPAGDFYICVSSYSSVKGMNYHLKPTLEASSAWEAEFNNTITTANEKPLNVATYGNLQTSSDEDWYKVKLPSAGRLDIKFGGDYGTSGSWKVQLYTSSNTEIWSDTYSAKNTVDQTICTVGLPAGDFYVRVDYSSSVAGMNYHFTPVFTASSAWEAEINDSITTANAKPLSSTIYGNLQDSSDEDWYKITMPEAGNLRLTFGAEYAKSGSWRVELYDSANNRKWNTTYSASNTSDEVLATTSLSAGTYYVRVDYSSSVAGLTYHFTPQVIVSISGATISSIPARIYNGAAYTPEPVVQIGSTVLRKDVDYTVSYANNVRAGNATITVTGKGKYVDSKSANFIINPVPMESTLASSIAAKTYTGKAIKPLPVVTYNGATLVNNSDYILTYKSNKKVGTGKVTISGTGNFTGSKTITFAINKAKLSAVTVKSVSAKTYTGKALKPAFKLKYKGVTLKKNVDYTIKYSHNVAVGKAKAVMTGKGNFKGKVTKTFKIKKARNTITAKNISKTFDANLDTERLAKTASFKVAAKAKWNSKKLVFKKSNGAGAKYITVSKKGKVTVKRGLPYGTYKVKVKITSKGAKNYTAVNKTITAEVTVW